MHNHAQHLWSIMSNAPILVLQMQRMGDLVLSYPLIARLGRLGNLIEMLAVLAGVPLLLGLLGVFRDLLAAF